MTESDNNTMQFPTGDNQVNRLVKAFRTSLAAGMASTGMSTGRIQRALDALEPDIRMLGESLIVDSPPATVWEYQEAVLTKATAILRERLALHLERQ